MKATHKNMLRYSQQVLQGVCKSGNLNGKKWYTKQELMKQLSGKRVANLVRASELYYTGGLNIETMKKLGGEPKGVKVYTLRIQDLVKPLKSGKFKLIGVMELEARIYKQVAIAIKRQRAETIRRKELARRKKALQPTKMNRPEGAIPQSQVKEVEEQLRLQMRKDLEEKIRKEKAEQIRLEIQQKVELEMRAQIEQEVREQLEQEIRENLMQELGLTNPEENNILPGWTRNKYISATANELTVAESNKQQRTKSNAKWKTYYNKEKRRLAKEFKPVALGELSDTIESKYGLTFNKNSATNLEVNRLKTDEATDANIKELKELETIADKVFNF